MKFILEKRQTLVNGRDYADHKHYFETHTDYKREEKTFVTKENETLPLNWILFRNRTAEVNKDCEKKES